MVIPFHYRMLRSVLAVADCHLREVDAGWSYQLHEHSGYELLHCYSGQLTEWIHGDPVVMSAGEWLLIGPGVKHSTINESNLGFVYFSVHFGIEDPELTHALKDMNYVHLSQRIERLQEEFADLLGYIKRNQPSETDTLHAPPTVNVDSYDVLAKYNVQLSIQSLVLHAVELAMKQAGNGVQASRKRLHASEVELAHVIQQKLIEAVYTDLEINQIAKQLFISRSHCNEVFKKVYGIAPKRFLGVMKQRKAEELLVQSRHAVESIGEMLGFASLSAFSRQFKRWTTLSPQEYRLGRRRSEKG
ncbi:AraC family transcriptional regulator [Paenibacillus sp. CF384]|uniref:helix-turn-helix domain-containing protein n=1 Tax=Paenibacillus sp. CF384 TaxID=1884382 RepID=UPI00089C79A5|nr:AraC family transcriptional regulator [Paenibacillus sp. CF384]SDW34280.1 AraC-type DNA-binding protein [Paenibacillus sp. CF384]